MVWMHTKFQWYLALVKYWHFMILDVAVWCRRTSITFCIEENLITTGSQPQWMWSKMLSFLFCFALILNATATCTKWHYKLIPLYQDTFRSFVSQWLNSESVHIWRNHSVEIATENLLKPRIQFFRFSNNFFSLLLLFMLLSIKYYIILKVGKVSSFIKITSRICGAFIFRRRSQNLFSQLNNFRVHSLSNILFLSRTLTHSHTHILHYCSFHWNCHLYFSLFVPHIWK